MSGTLGALFDEEERRLAAEYAVELEAFRKRWEDPVEGPKLKAEQEARWKELEEQLDRAAAQRQDSDEEDNGDDEDD